jgi:CRP-like cAMP-binding protein
MVLPLRMGRTETESHPFITRLRSYVALTEPEIADLRAAFERRLSIKKRRDVVLEGYESHKLHIVVSGVAMRYKMLANGKRQVLSVVLPSDIIGMPAVFFKPSHYSVTATSDMVVDLTSLQKILDVCYRVPRLAIGMLWYSQMELVYYADRIVDIGRRSPLERVAHFLLELHARLRSAGRAPERSFEMPLSQEIIGDLLGLSTPHVNRMLHQLQAERLICMDRRRITLEDKEGLQLIAQFEPLAPPNLTSCP